LCALFGYQRQGRTKEKVKEEEDREGEDPTRFRILLQSKEADDLSFSSRAGKKQIKSISLSLSLSLSSSLSIERQNLWISSSSLKNCSLL